MNRLLWILTFCYSSLIASEHTLSEWDLYEEEAAYLKGICEEDSAWIGQIKQLNENVGSALFDYEGLGLISPSTLRAVKMLGDLKTKFGNKLRHMHVVEISEEPSQLNDIIHHFIDVASYESVKNHDKIPRTTDIVLITNLETIDLNSIRDNISSIPCGMMSGTVAEEDFSIVETIRFLLSMNKKGNCIISKINNNFLHYTLSWKTAEENQPSSLVASTPNPSKIEPKNHVFISYGLSGGRLGDNLLAYCRAKWVAMKFGLPLIVKPFKMFDEFHLSKMDYPFALKQSVKHKIDFKHLTLIPNVKKNSVITIPYFPEYSNEKYTTETPMKRFQVEWDDPKFKQELKKCLAPIRNIPTIRLPADKVTIALHVRRGGNYESHQELNLGFPLKAPNDEYYIQQLRLVCELFKEKLLYIYLFTDDTNPQAIATSYAKKIGNKAITFDWKKEGEASSKDSVLGDFFSIATFDCLIRSASNFSLMAGKLGDYIIESTPLDACIEDGKSTITKYEILFMPK